MIYGRPEILFLHLGSNDTTESAPRLPHTTPPGAPDPRWQAWLTTLIFRSQHEHLYTSVCMHGAIHRDGTARYGASRLIHAVLLQK